MDELADYTDHQFETKLQIEIEQLTKNKQAQESPKAYLLGGQPGAGKSGLHQLIKAEDPNAITIDNDTFKWLHPKYKQLEQKYGKDVVKYVTPFSNQMTESLIDYLSDKKFDLIIEGTLRTVVQSVLSEKRCWNTHHSCHNGSHRKLVKLRHNL